MMICTRCGENQSLFTLCSECEFRLITGSATFTPADLAAWEQEIEFQIDYMIEAMHA